MLMYFARFPWRLLVGLLVLGSACVFTGACEVTETELCSTGLRCPANTMCTADGTGCRYSDCGDGIVQEQEMEECDDGNRSDGDGCSKDCTLESGSSQEPGEEYDDD